MTVDPQTGEVFNPPWQKYIDEARAARADADRLAAGGFHASICSIHLPRFPQRCDCGWSQVLAAHDVEVSER